MIKSNNIIINKTARYFTLGHLTRKTKTVWLVFHGYGQLAKEFLYEFKVLKNPSTYIVAPEALNKFYLRGFTGKIGSTWMTKEDRANEIDSYTHMIEQIFQIIKEDINLQNVKINILGFSQGSHTAVRWLNKYHHKINNLFLWGTSIPHDCDYKNKYWLNIQPKIIVGNNDRFLTKIIIEKEEKYLESQNIIYTIYNFNGKHEIDSKMLLKLSNE